jgi:hypothetical protein
MGKIGAQRPRLWGHRLMSAPCGLKLQSKRTFPVLPLARVLRPMISVTPGISLFLVLACGLAAADEHCPPRYSPTSVDELRTLIKSPAVEGVPLAWFRAFQKMDGADALAKGFLEDPNADSSPAVVSNALYALGAIGTRDAFNSVLKFLKEPTDRWTRKPKLSLAAFNLKVDALYSLGYMGVYSLDPQVGADARVLLDSILSAHARFWDELKWEAPRQPSQEVRNAYLAREVSQINREMGNLRSPKAVAEVCDPTTRDLVKLGQASALPSH